ncbi:MAG: hypothetical protein HC923_06585 [Myxococcales bacterium]|nr:hypothetical protein [Myxococcales bacterium]
MSSKGIWADFQGFEECAAVIEPIPRRAQSQVGEGGRHHGSALHLVRVSSRVFESPGDTGDTSHVRINVGFR